MLNCHQRQNDVFGYLRREEADFCHAAHEGRQEKLDRCLREAEIYRENGIDAMIVEDYFGDASDVEAGLGMLSARGGFRLGVNVLDDWELSWKLAKEYGADFIQVDSVAGHLSPEDDVPYAEMIGRYMAEGGMYVIGGVRFKYKQVLSGNDLETDLRLGMQRCHAIAVTGDGTGMDSPTAKIREFRSICGGFPLIVSAGMDVHNAAEKLVVGDAAIVGSTFKDTRKDTGDVCAAHVKEFMDEVRRIREAL